MERHSNVYNILRTSRISDLPLESRCCRGSWTDCVLLPGLQVLTGTLASALGFPVKVLVNLRTPGSKQGEGFLINAKAAIRLLQVGNAASPVTTKRVMTLAALHMPSAIGSQMEQAGNLARRGTPAITVSAHSHAPYREAPNPRHGHILTASASAFSLETLPPATTDSKAVTQRCLSGKLGASK